MEVVRRTKYAGLTRQQLRESQRNHAEGRYGGVTMAFISPGGVETEFCESALGAVLYDARHQQLMIHAGGYVSMQSSPRIAETRSQIVDHFLGNAGLQRSEWLWTVDSDMVFEPDALYQLLSHADPIERPVIGGLCFGGRAYSTQFPTIYSLMRDDQGRLSIDKERDYPTDALVKVGGTGAAFMLIHRNVLIRMLDPHPRGFGTTPDGTPNPYPWYAEGHVDSYGRPYGEDIAFCMRVNALGLGVFVHTGVKIGHKKSAILTEETYEMSRERVDA